MPRRPSRTARLGPVPRVEPLEGRELLSHLTAPSVGRTALLDRHAAGRVHAEQNPSGGSSGGGSSGSSGSLPSGTPTPHEQAREKFTAVYYGPYVTGPGRYAQQAFQTSITGGGTSSQFLHGNLQLALFTPSDPSQGVTGTAKMYDKSFLMTGNILYLNVQGDPQPNPNGRPTVLTWTATSSGSSNSSSGAFANSSGQGTLTIRYFPRRGKLPPRATGAGEASVVFQGQLYTIGTNPSRLPAA